MAELSEVLHLVGPVVTVGTAMRQRCSWCGALILDHDLAKISRMLEPGEDPDNPDPWKPATWPFGGLVAMAGVFPAVTWVVEPEYHEDGTPKVPESSCMNVDDAVTR